jgi:anaerobic ribonucleoside-triphosphate reductase
MTDKPDIKLDDSERTKCEVWTRVMGYHRPITSFNTGKKQERKERKYFAMPDMTEE